MGRNCARARDKSLITILTKSRRGLGVMTASIIIKPPTPTGGLIVAGMGLGLIGGSGAQLRLRSRRDGGVWDRGFCSTRHFGQPCRFQADALKVAITLELLAFLALGRYGHDWSFERLLLAVLVVVSAPRSDDVRRMPHGHWM